MATTGALTDTNGATSGASWVWEKPNTENQSSPKTSSNRVFMFLPRENRILRASAPSGVNGHRTFRFPWSDFEFPDQAVKASNHGLVPYRVKAGIEAWMTAQRFLIHSARALSVFSFGDSVLVECSRSK